MTHTICRTPEELVKWSDHLLTLGEHLPITVTWKKGADRTLDQNALSHIWYSQIGAQRDDMDASGARAHCKLNHGVKMLHAESPEFRESWNRLIRGRFTYEELLELMVPPHDYPVTRLMGVKQMMRFLDSIYDEWTAQGVRLTLPPPLS